MHDDEVVATPDQVRRLVATQHPRWADLPVTPVTAFGTDHVLHRLGDDLLVRMPRAEWAVAQVESDVRWLPLLAPHLPLAVPRTLAVGEPGEGYPWRWSVVEWLEGEALTPDNADPVVVAEQLADLVRALGAVDPGDGPVASGTSRGVPLDPLDESVRTWLPRLEGFDRHAVAAAWEDALAAPAWDGPPRWIHGDLLGGNLLVRDGRLAAVIDFGCVGLGDPATDLHTAYAILEPAARAVFRERVGHDEDAWRRARGWALVPSVTGATYYARSVPAFAERSRRMIRAVLDEVG